MSPLAKPAMLSAASATLSVLALAALLISCEATPSKLGRQGLERQAAGGLAQRSRTLLGSVDEVVSSGDHAHRSLKRVITLTDDDYTNGWVLGEEYGANGYNYQQPRKESTTTTSSNGGSFVWVDGEDDDIAQDRTMEKLYEREGTATTTAAATAAAGRSPSPPASSLLSAASGAEVQQAHLRGISTLSLASTSKDSEEQRRHQEEQLRLHQDIILGSSGKPHWIGRQDQGDDDLDDIIPFLHIIVNEDYESFGLAGEEGQEGEDGERLRRGQRHGSTDSVVPSVALVALALAAATLACALFVVSLTTVAVLRAWRASAGRARLSGSDNAAEPLLV